MSEAPTRLSIVVRAIRNVSQVIEDTLTKYLHWNLRQAATPQRFFNLYHVFGASRITGRGLEELVLRLNRDDRAVGVLIGLHELSGSLDVA